MRVEVYKMGGACLGVLVCRPDANLTEIGNMMRRGDIVFKNASDASESELDLLPEGTTVDGVVPTEDSEDPPENEDLNRQEAKGAKDSVEDAAPDAGSIHVPGVGNFET